MASITWLADLQGGWMLKYFCLSRANIMWSFVGRCWCSVEIQTQPACPSPLEWQKTQGLRATLLARTKAEWWWGVNESFGERQKKAGGRTGPWGNEPFETQIKNVSEQMETRVECHSRNLAKSNRQPVIYYVWSMYKWVTSVFVGLRVLRPLVL